MWERRNRRCSSEFTAATFAAATWLDYGDPIATYGIDFLKTTRAPPDVACVLTNWPFKIINSSLTR
jgi:hypothetical protein